MTPRKRGDSALTRNVVITGAVLTSFSVCAVALLVNANRETEFAADHASNQTRLIAAMQERLPEPAKIDRRLAIQTPGPHIKVAAIPLPTPRPTIPAPDGKAIAKVEPVLAEDNQITAYAPAVQPMRLASAEAIPFPREIDAKPTGSIGLPSAPISPASPPAKPKRPLTAYEKLYGPVRVASLTPANVVMRDASPSLPAAPYDQQTAVYVISSRKVYLPDGTELEAHSGLGQHMDDPKFAHVRMRGVTPPHVYNLAMRESLFHGVEAIRLKPIGGEQAIFGRDGLLAHTYMLGPRGDSNGCVSFRNYNAFLQAFKAKKFDRLAVIAHLD